VKTEPGVDLLSPFWIEYKKVCSLELKGGEMKRYVCTVCGYIYVPENGDPDGGIAPGTPFEKLPAGWVCPMCGAGKEAFEEE